MTTATVNSQRRDRSLLQFSIRALLLLMTGVGIACVLTPTTFRWGRLSAGCQVFVTVYLLIGLAQAWLYLPQWWRIRTSLTVIPPATHDPAEFIRFGCKLTLPTFALLVTALAVWKFAGVSVFQGSMFIFDLFIGLWVTVGLMFQAGGIIVNLKNCIYLAGSIDTASKRLAVLNLAHTLAFVLGVWMGWLLELL